MLNRRSFLKGSLAGASLLSIGTVVPEFIAQTAHAADEQKKEKENVLVVIELTGGNDGLNTVVPHADDLYQKARPTLRFNKQQVIPVSDEIGLHPSFGNWRKMIGDKQVAVIQGVGYPNPDRSHFESMDIWHSADPKRRTPSGWVGRAAGGLNKSGEVPLMHLGSNRLPLALQGSSGGAVSVNDKRDYRLHLGTNEAVERKSRSKILTDLSEPEKGSDADSMLAFVQKRQLQTYSSLDKLQEILNQRPEGGVGFGQPQNSLMSKLQLVAGLISTGFGTRVYYVALDGFDTHSGQAPMHANLLQQLADAVFFMYQTLQQRGQDKRVVTMTFSEFGRRVVENGSKGTDHGSGSSMFVVGPAVQGGLIGKHPSLKDLDDGDIKHHTDFRRVYATILDRWLGVRSKDVLAGTFEPLDFLKAKS